jgi:uncharacterized protein (TIGR03067 family)
VEAFMKWWINCLVLAPLALQANAGSEKADRAKMEGTWEIVALDIAGKQTPAGPDSLDRIVIKGAKATFFAGKKELPTFKDIDLRLDPAKKPRAVDFVRAGRETLPCLYEVTDDTLKFVIPLVPTKRKPGDELPRPQSFETRDRPVMLVTAKRSKQ